MSEPYLTAFIGAMAAIIAAILTIFLQPLWSNKIGKKAALTAEIRLHRSTLPKYLRDSIESYLYSYKRGERPSEETRKKLRAVRQNDGLVEILIRNNSKIAVDDICIILGDGKKVVYDLEIDGRMGETVFSQKVDIGTLLPSSRANVLIWHLSKMEDDPSWMIRKAITIQARNYDKVVVNYPIPRRFSEEYLLISRRTYWAVVWTVLGMGLAVTLFSGHTKSSATNEQNSASPAGEPTPLSKQLEDGKSRTSSKK